MNIIILGPQGSGKGTQGELLAKHFNFYYLSTGQMFREMAKTRRDIAETINSGGLLPDDEVIKEVTTFLEQKGILDNMIIDGTPRSLYQYKKLRDWFAKNGKKIDIAFFLSIDDQEIIKRLSARRVDSKTGHTYNLVTNPPPASVSPDDLVQRADDHPDALATRFKAYHEMVEPLVQALREDGSLIEVDGMRPIEDIQSDLVSIVKKHE